MNHGAQRDHERAASPGNADDAVKAFEKTTTKAAAFGSAIGGLAVKGVTALWDTVKGFAGRRG